MDAVIETVSSRNMWAIMKQFNALPTEARVQNLTQEQIDWIIGNMNYDVKEAEAISKGWQKEDGGSFRDKDFDDYFENSTDKPLMPEGFNADDIYKQVVELTTDPDYETMLADKIIKARTVVTEKKLNYDKYVAEQIAKNRENFLAKAKEMADKGQQNKQIAQGYFGDDEDLDDLL